MPDMPVDEEIHEHFMRTCQQFGLSNILVISPGLSDARLQLIAQYQERFVYCTARAGTTGIRSSLGGGFKRELKRIQKYIKVPLAVGFGISEPAQIQQLKGSAQIAVVGSAIVERLAKGDIKKLESYLTSLPKPTGYSIYS